MYLVIQSRLSKSGWHEYKLIYEASGLSYHHLTQINLLSDGINSKIIKELVKNAEGIIIGGSEEITYKEENTEKRRRLDIVHEKLFPVLKEVFTEIPEKKILGICFGHQLIAEVLHAKVAFTPEQRELGIEEITLTKEGERDPLFQGLDKKFFAIEGHHDAVLQLPKNTVHLASSKKCSVQAYRYRKNIYGVQFHPELDYEDLQWRLNLDGNDSYRKAAAKVKEEYQIVTKDIIKNFIKL